MDRNEATVDDDHQERKLDKLIMRISLMPESQSPHRYELADTIKQQLQRPPISEDDDR